MKEMDKPDVKDVLEIAQMKKEAAALYEAIDTKTAAIKDEFGAGRFDYDLEAFIDEYSADDDFSYGEELLGNGRYLKLEITDNVAELAGGKDIWKSVAFKPVSVKVQSLKRCPVSLK